MQQDRERARQIIDAAQETKALDIVLYDLERRSSVTDYVVVCSGRSQAHVRGICDRIEERLRKEHRIKPYTVEGRQEGSWILLDYGVVIVHIFHPETRAYYDLDTLLEAYPSQHFAPAPAGARLAGDEGAAPA